MSKKIEIGPYSAYAIAVKYGYDGTEEDWIKAVEAARKSAETSAANAKREADGASTSAATATEQAGIATAKASESAASAEASASSASAAATSEANAKKYSEEAGAKASTDKTLSIENAPADAKAVGDIILDRTKDTPEAIFYSKAEVEAKIKEAIVAALSERDERDYDVGSFYASNNPTSPAQKYGGTWERIEDCTIWGASDTHPAGTKLEAGLPNITGSFAFSSYSGAGGWLSVSEASGVFKGREGSGAVAQAGDTGVQGAVAVDMDASKSSQIYGASDTVQPPAYCMYIWRRVA